MSTKDDLDAVRAQERRRIARDVHDALGGDLAAIKMALVVLARRLPHDQGVHEQLSYIDKLVDAAIDSMHQVVAASPDPSMDRLDRAVGSRVEEFMRQSGLACNSELDHVSLDMDEPVAQALHAILRESLTNVGKHAKARQVRVALRQTEERLILEVEDDGVGPASDHAGFGLRGMRERAEELGGEFSIQEVAPHGTLVLVEIPMGNMRV